MNLNQVSLPALDLVSSIDFYQRLGLKLIVETEIYARFELPDGDATLSLFASDSVGAGPHVYFECADLDQRVAALKEQGMVFDDGPENKRWLWREASLRDPAGNAICLYWAGSNRKDPPWRIRTEAKQAE